MTVNIDDTALDLLLTDQAGPVGIDLEDRVLRVENEVVRLLSQPGLGRQYGRHRASAPGQPPAVDTGHYRASIRQDIGKDALGLYGDIGSDLRISVYLELGTRFMAPRPHLRPAIDAAK